MVIRFGGITNFEAVRSFFENFEAGRNAGNSLHHLRYDPTKKSAPGRLFLEMEFDGTGDQPRIECRSPRITTSELGCEFTPEAAEQFLKGGDG